MGQLLPGTRPNLLVVLSPWNPGSMPVWPFK